MSEGGNARTVLASGLFPSFCACVALQPTNEPTTSRTSKVLRRGFERQRRRAFGMPGALSFFSKNIVGLSCGAADIPDGDRACAPLDAGVRPVGFECRKKDDKLYAAGGCRVSFGGRHFVGSGGVSRRVAGAYGRSEHLARNAGGRR